MATQVVSKVKVISGTHLLNYPEASSQSFKQGQAVYLVSGKLTVVADNGVVILGFAAADASGTVDTMLPVDIVDSTSILYGNANSTTAITNVGVKYAVVNASGIMEVNVGELSHDALVIIALDNNEVGDTYGHVYFKVLPEALQIGAAAS